MKWTERITDSVETITNVDVYLTEIVETNSLSGHLLNICHSTVKVSVYILEKKKSHCGSMINWDYRLFVPRNTNNATTLSSNRQ